MRVLVVEDHATLARSIANGLREEGFAVYLSSDGEEALGLAKINPYDCLILDVMLPGRDGWSVLQQIRRVGSQVPVLMLTARDGLDDKVKGLNLGADDYLIKPFAWDELLARVRALVRRGHGQKSPVVIVADLQIDTASKTVQRAGKTIALSGREYAAGIPGASRRESRQPRRDLGSHI